MKKLILLLLFIPLVSFGQDLEKEKLKTVVNTFFEGFHSKDSLLIVSVIDKSFDLNSTSLKEGKGVLTNINGDNFVSRDLTKITPKRGVFSFHILIKHGDNTNWKISRNTTSNLKEANSVGRV